MSDGLKPNKKTRAKNRAVIRLTKALDLASNALVDMDLAKPSHYTKMAVARANDAIRDALRAIFDEKTP